MSSHSRFALNELFSAKHYLTHRLNALASVRADHPHVNAIMLELANVDSMIEDHPERVPTPPKEPVLPTHGPGSNTGHGHVWTRPDGVKFRCGGVGFCTSCMKDLVAYGYSPKHG